MVLTFLVALLILTNLVTIYLWRSVQRALPRPADLELTRHLQSGEVSIEALLAAGITISPKTPLEDLRKIHAWCTSTSNFFEVAASRIFSGHLDELHLHLADVHKVQVGQPPGHPSLEKQLAAYAAVYTKANDFIYRRERRDARIKYLIPLIHDLQKGIQQWRRDTQGALDALEHDRAGLFEGQRDRGKSLHLRQISAANPVPSVEGEDL